jgi:hypothetical protein
MNLAVPIGLFMFAILFGVAAWILVIFGAWPAVVLVLISAILGIVAVRRIKKIDAPTRP